jgi:ABC-2 type transport system permease protein
MTTPTAVAPLAPPLRAARRKPTLLDAIAWETTKLAAQARARFTLLICLIAPLLIVIVIKGQQRPPKDSLFGRHIHQSGYAVPLLVLGFAAQWVLPLLTALVAGDIFASEDQHGTWKTVLTRSASRAQLFWAKTITALAFAIAVLVVIAVSTILTSVVVVGHQDLTGLTGQIIPSGTAARLVIASWAIALAPMLGFTCLAILLSVRSRNPAFGIAAPIRPLLLTTPFESWHGLLAQHPFYAPLIWGLIASAGWCVVCLTTAFISLRRRDIAGG